MKKEKYRINEANNPIPPFSEFRTRGERGTGEDVRFLMQYLNIEQSFAVCKQIDFSLSLVNSKEGIRELKHFLFKGELIQRNYAALYFKRRNEINILNIAVEEGCIDEIQAFSQ